MSVAERLWVGCEGDGFDLLEVPCCRGLSLGEGCPFRRDWAGSSRDLSRSPPLAYVAAWDGRALEGLLLLLPAVAVEAWLRCEEVRGGGMGPVEVMAGDAMAGEACVEGGSGWVCGVFRAELFDNAGEW